MENGRTKSLIYLFFHTKIGSRNIKRRDEKGKNCFLTYIKELFRRLEKQQESNIEDFDPFLRFFPRFFLLRKIILILLSNNFSSFPSGAS